MWKFIKRQLNKLFSETEYENDQFELEIEEMLKREYTMPTPIRFEWNMPDGHHVSFEDPALKSFIDADTSAVDAVIGLDGSEYEDTETRKAMNHGVLFMYDEFDHKDPEDIRPSHVKPIVLASPANMVHTDPTLLAYIDMTNNMAYSTMIDKMTFEEWLLDGNDDRIRTHFNCDIANELKIQTQLNIQYQTYLEV